MLTAESIRQYYVGPRCKGDDFTWRWYRKGGRWPRSSFTLTFKPSSRSWMLERADTANRKSKGPCDRTFFALDHPQLAIFRSLIAPADLARCVAASLLENRRA